MKESSVSIWAVVTFLIGTLVGTGGVWEWKKVEIEAQKQQVEKTVQTTELREKENEQYSKILDLTNVYIGTVDQYSKAPSPQLNNKILQLKAQLEVMKDNFTTLENNLGQLEGRQPRNIPINFIPPAPPTGLTAVVH
jgi:hypothetical protein